MEEEGQPDALPASQVAGEVLQLLVRAVAPLGQERAARLAGGSVPTQAYAGAAVAASAVFSGPSSTALEGLAQLSECLYRPYLEAAEASCRCLFHQSYRKC